MYTVTEETLKKAYKPYDVVTDAKGNVGFIAETNINECQPEPHQISYAVNWMVGKGDKFAWYQHDQLIKHCNIFVEIAKQSCNPMGHNLHKVPLLLSTGL